MHKIGKLGASNSSPNYVQTVFLFLNQMEIQLLPLQFWRVLTPAATLSGHTEQRSLDRMGFFVLNRVRVFHVTKAYCAVPNELVRLTNL